MVGGNSASLITAISPLLSLILGVLLATFAIGAIISWIKH